VKILNSTGTRTPTSRSVASRYTDCATTDLFATEETNHKHLAPGSVHNPHCAAACMVAYPARHGPKQHSTGQVASSLKCNSVHMWKRKPIINIRIGIVVSFKSSRSRLDCSSGIVPRNWAGRSAGR
jgi:hypothetical protein